MLELIFRYHLNRSSHGTLLITIKVDHAVYVIVIDCSLPFPLILTINNNNVQGRSVFAGKF